MKEIEQLIISSVFGEDNYRKVSFLEPNDFKDYPTKPFRSLWKLIDEHKAYDLTVLTILAKSKNEDLKQFMLGQCDIVTATHIQRYALILLENRFKTLFLTLLVKLSNDVLNVLERQLLGEIQSEVLKQDIFELTDNVIDYLGSQGSDTTKNRINDFISYRDKRANEAKRIINVTK